MQASPRVSHPAYTYVDRIVTAIGSGRRLLVPDALPESVPWPHLPTAWTVVSGSESASAGERFAAYANGDAIVTVQAIRAGAPDPAGRLVALVTIGPHRISIADCGDGRFDARWTCDDLDFRLTTGRYTLGAFMKLLLAIGWR